MGQKILIIEDDLEIAELLETYLNRNHLETLVIHRGDEAEKTLNENDFDLILLDVMLPGKDGFEILQETRQNDNHKNIPIIMLTARGDDMDRIIGLEMGADDYLPKPFNPRELLARMQSVLRRYNKEKIKKQTNTSTIEWKDIKVSLSGQIATLKDEPLNLTATELLLLYHLVTKAGAPISKDELSEEVLGRKLQPYDRAIDVHISHLRKKINQLKPNADWIVSLRGKGYQLKCD